TNAGVQSATDGIYAQEVINLNSASLLNQYDDVVSYKEVWQLQTASSAVPPFACMYMTDWSGLHLFRYYTNTKSWSIIKTLAANHYTTGVAVDSSGNIYLADYYNTTPTSSTIQKYTASTGVWATFISTNLNGPTSVYFDKSGNIW